MERFEYFKSPIYAEIIPEWVNELNHLTDPYIIQAKKTSQPAIDKRNEVFGNIGDKGWSHHSTPLDIDPNFSNFHKSVAERAKGALTDMGYDISNHSLVYTESWVQEFSHLGAGHHWFHTHNNNHISGFYFLKVSERTSKPMFQDPRTAHVMMKLPEKNPDTPTNVSDIITWNPKPGTLILFPAYLSHGYQVDLGIEPFRFIHINLQAIQNQFLGLTNK